MENYPGRLEKSEGCVGSVLSTMPTSVVEGASSLRGVASPASHHALLADARETGDVDAETAEAAETDGLEVAVEFHFGVAGRGMLFVLQTVNTRDIWVRFAVLTYFRPFRFLYRLPHTSHLYGFSFSIPRVPGYGVDVSGLTMENVPSPFSCSCCV